MVGIGAAASPGNARLSCLLHRDQDFLNDPPQTVDFIDQFDDDDANFVVPTLGFLSVFPSFNDLQRGAISMPNSIGSDPFDLHEYNAATAKLLSRKGRLRRVACYLSSGSFAGLSSKTSVFSNSSSLLRSPNSFSSKASFPNSALIENQ